MNVINIIDLEIQFGDDKLINETSLLQWFVPLCLVFSINRFTF